MLEISVQKNEHNFYPDFFGNLELPEQDRFCFVLRKGNKTVLSVEARYKETGTFSILEYLRRCVVRIVNAPVLVIGDEKKAMTLEDLVHCEELATACDQLIIAVGELQEKGRLDPKK